jgi:SRSO17 transposase
MTARQPVDPAPGPLEAYCTHFDDLFRQRSQREGLRRYLEGLLLPQERHKTLTALANTEPVVGAQHPCAQSLQWFLSESRWDPEVLTQRRLELLCADPRTAPTAQGVLVIDEHGDRKWGTKTAHVGRQYLANLGKTDNGVVSVTSLWADEGLYYPLHVEPYTPAHHFARGKTDPAFRTKLVIAVELLARAVAAGIPFRAVVADSFYGEDATFRQGLGTYHLPYVLALRPSHGWWHRVGTIGTLWQAAQAKRWGGPARPGRWVAVTRQYRDGHVETWWALEIEAGPYGPTKPQRAVVVSTDPSALPERTTWYLATNLPHPAAVRAAAAPVLPAADLAEVVRLYGLRLWVEQSYKQTKYALGWSDYQVRSDLAIRRHWALVCCAFAFCWHHQHPEGPSVPLPDQPSAATLLAPAPAGAAGRGEKERHGAGATAPARLAGGPAGGPGLAGALDPALALLARLLASAPASCAPRGA